MINNKLIWGNIIFFGIFTIILTFISDLDLTISGYFFDNKLGFIYKNNNIALFFFRIIPISVKLLSLFCVIGLISLYYKHKNFNIILKSSVFFLLMTSIIVPGFIVNTVLKENFGRARPRQVQEFNGNKEFTPAFVITDQCKNNCSFSSGHAAMAFYFTAIAYVIGRRYFSSIYCFGVTIGICVGMSRIIMGGHFASDVITSAFIVLLVNHLIFLWWQKIILRLKT